MIWYRVNSILCTLLLGTPHNSPKQVFLFSQSFFIDKGHKMTDESAIYSHAGPVCMSEFSSSDMFKERKELNIAVFSNRQKCKLKKIR